MNVYMMSYRSPVSRRIKTLKVRALDESAALSNAQHWLERQYSYDAVDSVPTLRITEWWPDNVVAVDFKARKRVA